MGKTTVGIMGSMFCRKKGSLSTVVGDEKLTSREDHIGLLFLHVQNDENSLTYGNALYQLFLKIFFFANKKLGRGP